MRERVKTLKYSWRRDSAEEMKGHKEEKNIKSVVIFPFYYACLWRRLVKIEQTLYVTDFVIYAAKNVYGQWKSKKKSQLTFT